MIEDGSGGKVDRIDRLDRNDSGATIQLWPSSFENPFRTAPGSDPPRLVGRDAEISLARFAIGMTRSGAPAAPVIITGQRGAAWMHHRDITITESDVEAIIPGVRNLLDSSLYNGHFRALTPRECAYVLALSDLGAGSHTVGEIAESLGSTSERLSSIRNRLIKKDVLFVPSVGMVEFRIPLSDRYVRRHRAELERRAAKTPIVPARSVQS